MKIGILGGTFDPIHRGHLFLARHALKQFKLDKVLFIPAARPPHKKTGKKVSSVKHRLAMVRRALAGMTRFKISKIETERTGPSYTVDTLKALKKKHPNAEFFLILGQDAYRDLKNWKDPETIQRLARFLVARRPGGKVSRKKIKKTPRIRMPLLPVSSSEIRRRVKSGKEVDDYVPDRVARYIRSQRLYRPPL